MATRRKNRKTAAQIIESRNKQILRTYNKTRGNILSAIVQDGQVKSEIWTPTSNDEKMMIESGKFKLKKDGTLDMRRKTDIVKWMDRKNKDFIYYRRGEDGLDIQKVEKVVARNMLARGYGKNEKQAYINFKLAGQNWNANQRLNLYNNIYNDNKDLIDENSKQIGFNYRKIERLFEKASNAKNSDTALKYMMEAEDEFRKLDEISEQLFPLGQNTESTMNQRWNTESPRLLLKLESDVENNQYWDTMSDRYGISGWSR